MKQELKQDVKEKQEIDQLKPAGTRQGDAAYQRDETRQRSLMICIGALMVGLMAVLSQIVIAIGPVPFNLGVLGAYLMGLMLIPRYALLSMLCYFILGALGVPVFAGLSGGPQVLFGLTGGYIVGYVFISYMSSLAERAALPLMLKLSVMVCSLILCYVLGTCWFMYLSGSGLMESLSVCVIPFVIPDLLKLAAALYLSFAIKKRLPKELRSSLA